MSQPAIRPASRYALAAVLGGLLVAAVGTAGVGEMAATACAPGALSRLYLGQDTPSGPLAEPEWRRFVDEAGAPRFPAGFTELHGHGHWRDARGAAIEEATRIVEIAHDGSVATHARIRGIASDYRVRFGQESVLITTTRADQCFETHGQRG